MFCERCDHRQSLQVPRRPPQEIAQLRSSAVRTYGEPSRFRANVRDILVQGIAAAKAGEVEDAHFYLEWVLRKPASDKEQAQAWLWLSEVYAEHADKRECLVQALTIEPNNGLARRGLAVLDGRLKREEIIDPNHVSSDPSQEPTMARARRFQCPRCSGRMHFSPDGQRLLCEFCDHREDVDGAHGKSAGATESEGWGMEQDFVVGLATAKGHLQPVLMRTMQCQGCGIEFTLAPKTLSVTCPYCDSVYVTDAAEDRETIAPQALIPFRLTQDHATIAMRDWLSGRVRDYEVLLPVIGLYLPVWTFDMTGEIPWSGTENRGDARVKVSGQYYVLKDDLLIAATRNASSQMKLCINDFDLEQAVNYDAGYLADWPAERHQTSLAEASMVARKELLEELRKEPHKLTSGRSVQELRLNSSGLTIDSYKLILLPIWMGHYEIEGRRFEVIINGQNGKVRGDIETGMVGTLISWFRGD